MSSLSVFISKALGSLLFGTFATMLVACLWFPYQLAQGAFQECFDTPSRRPVPWRVTSVGLIIVLYVLVNLTVRTAYVELRSLTGFDASKPQVVGKEGLSKTETTPPSSASKPAPLVAKSEKIVHAKSELSFTEMMALVSVINGILVLLVPWTLRLTSKASWEDLGVGSHEFMRNVKIGAAAFLVVTPVVMGIQFLAIQIWPSNRHPVELMLRQEASPSVILLAYVSAMVMAPLVEELIFRGVIQGWIRSEFLRPPRKRLTTEEADLVQLLDGRTTLEADTGFTPYLAPVSPLNPSISDDSGVQQAQVLIRRAIPIVLTSAFFALVHFDQMPAPIPIFVLALVLGWLYEVTGSLVASVVLHALFNGFNTTLMVFVLIANPQAQPPDKPSATDKARATAAVPQSPSTPKLPVSTH